MLGIPGVGAKAQRFDFCQCHFKVKIIFQGQMTARQATIMLHITPTFLVYFSVLARDALNVRTNRRVVCQSVCREGRAL